MKLKPSIVLTTASPTDISDGMHGKLSVAPAYGGFGKGRHSMFIKMTAGFVSQAHIHSRTITPSFSPA